MRPLSIREGPFRTGDTGALPSTLVSLIHLQLRMRTLKTLKQKTAEGEKCTNKKTQNWKTQK